MTMKVRSLFSGVGGIDLGLERAGMNVISQCEKDDFRREILRRHWPHAEVHDNVESVSYEAGSADLVCGGFPCQDLSVAGRRRGLAGSRSGLFFECARIADECVPEGGWLLIENVPGLLSSHGGRDFGVLLSTLADLGFHDIAWRVLDSRFFGVPQRRRRVFILARRSTGTRAGQVLLEPEGDGGHPQEGRKKATQRPLAAQGSTGNGSSPSLDASGEGASARGLTKRYGKGTDSDATDTMIIANALDRMRGGADDNDAQANHIVASTLTAPKSGTGGSYRLDDNDVRGHHVIPVGLGTDTSVSGTLGKKGVGGGGLGLDREGAMVVGAGDLNKMSNGPSADVLAFNWQSGGDVRLEINPDHVPTLQKEQVPAVHVLIAPEVAAPLTAGHATGEGVSKPGRRMEDDKNLVVFGAWNMKILEEGAPIGTLLGGSKGAQYSLNNMPLIAEFLNGTEESSSAVVYAANEYPTLRSNERNNSNPTTQAQMHVVTEAKAVSENQRAEVRETDVVRSTTKGGGKPGQGYPAARVVTDETELEGMVRRLTPTECERLQGFPDGWTHREGESLAGESSWYEVGVIKAPDGSAILVPRVSDIGYLDRLLASMMGVVDVEEPKPDGRRYAAMGDAVTVPVAHWIGARLLKYGTD